MTEYELDLTSEDLGEIIEILRVQHFKLHAEPFAKKIGLKENVLLSVEEGRGPHGLLALKKVNEAFHNVKVTFKVQVT
jgi:ribosome-binding protein aMBF1 (putative translation factor)